jgi:AcrR family transcriptional regulator
VQTMTESSKQWAAEVGVQPARRELAPTAQRILKAARRILIKKGYGALTMQQIEKESGTNRALVHYYFGSKAGLVDALVESLFEDPAFGYSDAVMRAPEGEQRRGALLAWLLRIVHDQHSARLLYELLPHFLRSAKLRAHVAELYAAYREFDGRCLASGVPSVGERDRQRLGALSVAVVEGLGVQLAVDSQDFDAEGPYAMWEEMVTAYLEQSKRATRATAPQEGEA